MNQHFNNVNYRKADQVPIAGDQYFVLPLLDKHVELFHYILILRVADCDQTFNAYDASYFINNVLVRALLAFLIVINRISNGLLILQTGLLILWSLTILCLIVVQRCVVVLHGESKGYQSIDENLRSRILNTVYTTDNAFPNVDIKILHCRKKRVNVNLIFLREFFHLFKNVEHYISKNVQPVVVLCKYTGKAQIFLEFLLFLNHL